MEVIEAKTTKREIEGRRSVCFFGNFWRGRYGEVDGGEFGVGVGGMAETLE